MMEMENHCVQLCTIYPLLPIANTCTEGDIRLVGGSSEYKGRVEVCINGKFGPICDTKWDDNDAKVVCGQLEYPVDGEDRSPLFII